MEQKDKKLGKICCLRINQRKQFNTLFFSFQSATFYCSLCSLVFINFVLSFPIFHSILLSPFQTTLSLHLCLSFSSFSPLFFIFFSLVRCFHLSIFGLQASVFPTLSHVTQADHKNAGLWRVWGALEFRMPRVNTALARKAYRGANSAPTLPSAIVPLSQPSSLSLTLPILGPSTTTRYFTALILTSFLTTFTVTRTYDNLYLPKQKPHTTHHSIPAVFNSLIPHHSHMNPKVTQISYIFYPGLSMPATYKCTTVMFKTNTEVNKYKHVPCNATL